VLAQPKRLALLALLAARPGAFHERDSLLATFWPDLDATHARWAMNQALRFLRKELGPSVFVGRSAKEVGIDSTKLWCDAAAFRRSLADGKYDDALDLYHGVLPQRPW
jgi:DNA-binding SARP family transcriptional activator